MVAVSKIAKNPSQLQRNGRLRASGDRLQLQIDPENEEISLDEQENDEQILSKMFPDSENPSDAQKGDDGVPVQ